MLDSVDITASMAGDTQNYPSSWEIVPCQNWELVLCSPLTDAMTADHTPFLPFLPNFISSVTLQPHLCDPHLSRVPYHCSVCKMS